ncbi:hypothetical protein DdX_21684 [Ditylenchus destructor]|uniref:Uncharacterized protein n=1 Tax=Ditylenchus destructor TaxID=166010 RepID=A0AAD4QVC6_9BILA|nr:hypothetical protein DdX_21684 [Ditylenchus destructor]
MGSDPYVEFTPVEDGSRLLHFPQHRLQPRQPPLARVAYQPQRAVQGRQWRFKDAQAAESQRLFQCMAREAGQAEAGNGGPA